MAHFPYPALHIEELEHTLAELLDARTELRGELDTLTQEIVNTHGELNIYRRIDRETNER